MVVAMVEMKMNIKVTISKNVGNLFGRLSLEGQSFYKEIIEPLGVKGEKRRNVNSTLNMEK
jgi:hypothetical protein